MSELDLFETTPSDLTQEEYDKMMRDHKDSVEDYLKSLAV